MVPVSHSPKRRRGAPYGNCNALKHGFYAARFHSTDLANLQNIEFAGLKEEIAMMRILIRRIVEMSKKANDDDSISLLRVLGLACVSLSRMVTTQQLLFPQTNVISTALHQALEEVNREMGLPQ